MFRPRWSRSQVIVHLRRCLWLPATLRRAPALEEGDVDAVEKEFADVIAWLASLANITGIDLERAAIDKYSGKCPKCQKAPCQCTF